MLQLTNPSITARVDMSQVSLDYSLPTAPGSTGGNYNLQLFLQRKSDGGWEQTVPRDAKGAPIRIALFPNGAINTGTLQVSVKPDTYSGGKAVLFAEGSNFSDPTPVEFAVDTAFTVATAAVRVKAPVFEPGVPVVGADGKVTVPFTIKYPSDKALFDPASLPYNGFTYQAKGDVTESGGGPSGWVTTDKFVSTTADGDTYMMYQGSFVLTPTTSHGLKNLQFGLYNQSWSLFMWVWPGVTFALPGWVQKADPAQYPPISSAFAKGKAPVALGGNFGNALASLGTAANDSAQYFSLLASLGMTCLRLNYDADKYLSDPIYPDVVDQVVQHMLMAGVVPCIAPQGMPGGATAASEAALVKLAGIIAARYVGVPIIQDVVNEPHQYSTWAAWKPVAQRAIDAIKAASPNAQIVVGSEGYSADMTAAAADPFPAGTILAYCCHLYDGDPAKVAGHIGTTLPVWVQEYQTPSADWHNAVSALPNITGVAAWAWTTPGQDSLNLVQSIDGAALTLTPVGQGIANIYSAWRTGQAPSVPAVSVPASPAPALPTPPAAPAPAAPGVTLADVQALLTALAARQDAAMADASSKNALVIAAVQAKMAKDEATQSVDEATQKTDEGKDAALSASLTALASAEGLLKAQEASDVAALKAQIIALQGQINALRSQPAVTQASLSATVSTAVNAATSGIIAAVYAKIRTAFA